ncbi:hypothetical protein ACFQV2_17920 [Actinokineospora soli]|uniref:FAD binding domain-containing protein n=1 Tax=Actinokineospora soli TaxID=1048753 RepID=A0ABW2TQ99_9PSEU
MTALRRYEAARRDRTRWLVAASRRLSRLEQIANPVAAALRDLALRYAPERAVREQNALPMRYDLPAVPEGNT